MRTLSNEKTSRLLKGTLAGVLLGGLVGAVWASKETAPFAATIVFLMHAVTGAMSGFVGSSIGNDHTRLETAGFAIAGGLFLGFGAGFVFLFGALHAKPPNVSLDTGMVFSATACLPVGALAALLGAALTRARGERNPLPPES